MRRRKHAWSLIIGFFRNSVFFDQRSIFEPTTRCDGRWIQIHNMQTKPIKRGIEGKGFGMIREIGNFVASVVVELEVHWVDRGAAFFPELVFDGFDGEVKREADVGGEGFEIGMSHAQHNWLVPFHLLDARSHPQSKSLGNVHSRHFTAPFFYLRLTISTSSIKLN